MKTLIITILLPITLGMTKYRFLLENQSALPKGITSNTYKVVRGQDTIRVEFNADTICKIDTLRKNIN